jgi:signal transduction histidine kinase
MQMRPGHIPQRLWAPDPVVAALLDAMPTALAVVDGHGAIAYHNPAWSALASRASTYGDLGSLVTPGDRVGCAYLRRLSGLDGPLALAAHKLARAAQETLTGEGHPGRIPYRMVRPEGEEPFEALVSRLPGDKPLALVQHIEAGDRERIAEAEAVALEKGLEAEDLRSRQRRLARRLSQVGQDLHTPVTPVRLELHLLHSGALGPLTPAQGRAVSLAERNVQRWVDGERLFQRLATEIPDAPADLDLAPLVRAIVDARQTEALQSGQRLMAPHATAALPVHVSPDAIHSILDRFLDHALAATPAGAAVVVEVAVRDGEAVVEVMDSGAGRSAREVRALFEPWGARRPSAGADLALPHARLEAEKAGGRVWAESDGPGQGLLLGFALPLLGGGGFPSG